MTLAIDGTAGGQFSTGSTGTVTLTTTLANDVVVLMFYHSNKPGSTSPTISNVTSPHLTWAKRKTYTFNTGSGTNCQDLEIWWAPASSALTSEVITITLTGSIDDAAYHIFGVSGCANPSAPWDTNSSLPGANNSSSNSGGDLSLTVSGVSTKSASTMSIGAWGNTFNHDITIPSGTTQIRAPQHNSGGAFFAWMGSFYQLNSAALSSASFTGTSSSTDVWGIFVDALSQTAFTITTGVGNADGLASVSGTSRFLISSSAVGNADGKASVSGGALGAGTAPPRPHITYSGDRHVRRPGADYTQAFLALLPQGQAWPRHPLSTLARTCDGLSEYWGFVDGRAADLLEIESDPRQTVELLPDWERNWGLPDPCYTAPQTIGQRQLALVMRMTMQGGQSREFFIGIAAMLGYEITITEYRTFVVGLDRVGDARVYGAAGAPDPIMHNEWGIPIMGAVGDAPVNEGELSEYPYYGLGPDTNRFYWTVHVHQAALTWFRVTKGQTGVDPHLRIGLADDLECLLNRWKPAHTQIIFDYTNLHPGDPMEGTP